MPAIKAIAPRAWVRAGANSAVLGRFLDEWMQFGRASGIHIDENDMLYATGSASSDTANPGWKTGIRIGSAGNGTVKYFIPDPGAKPAGASGAEGVAADAQGNVYAADVDADVPPRALTKYVRR